MRLIKTTPAFPVRDIGMALDFYTSKLGFGCQYEDQGFAVLSRDGVELHLWASSDTSWRWRSLFLFLKPIRSGAESFLAGTHSCRIKVEQIEALYQELKEKRILYNAHTIIEKKAWGTLEFPVLDLHGNLITFYQTDPA